MVTRRQLTDEVAAITHLQGGAVDETHDRWMYVTQPSNLLKFPVQLLQLPVEPPRPGRSLLQLLLEPPRPSSSLLQVLFHLQGPGRPFRQLLLEPQRPGCPYLQLLGSFWQPIRCLLKSSAGDCKFCLWTVRPRVPLIGTSRVVFRAAVRCIPQRRRNLFARVA